MSALTRGFRNLITGSVGTVAVTVLAPNIANNYLRIHNPASTNSVLAVTYDGKTTPVVNGAGLTIYPGSADEQAIHVPTGAVMLVGSTTSSPYSLEWC